MVSRNRPMALLQDHVLRHHHEELRRSQYIPQVPHDHQVHDEDAVEQLGDHHIHVPRRRHGEQQAQLEHVVHRHDHSLLLGLPHCGQVPFPLFDASRGRKNAKEGFHFGKDGSPVSPILPLMGSNEPVQRVQGDSSKSCLTGRKLAGPEGARPSLWNAKDRFAKLEEFK